MRINVQIPNLLAYGLCHPTVSQRQGLTASIYAQASQHRSDRADSPLTVGIERMPSVPETRLARSFENQSLLI